MERVSWSIGPGTYPWLRRCCYAGAAVWGGFLLIAVGAGAALAIGALLAGDPGPALLAVLLVLVGGPFSVLYLWPILSDPAQRPAFLEPPPWVSWGWLLVGSSVVATLFLALPALGVVLFVTGFATGFLAALFRTEGALNPGAGTLTVDVHDIDLADLRGARRLNIGELSVLRLYYEEGAGFAMARRFVILPGDAADRVLAAIERTDGVSCEEPSANESRPAVRAVLAGFGLGALALAAAIHMLESMPTNVALYGSIFFGVGGAIFLWLAYNEG